MFRRDLELRSQVAKHAVKFMSFLRRRVGQLIAEPSSEVSAPVRQIQLAAGPAAVPARAQEAPADPAPGKRRYGQADPIVNVSDFPGSLPSIVKSKPSVGVQAVHFVCDGSLLLPRGGVCPGQGTVTTKPLPKQLVPLQLPDRQDPAGFDGCLLLPRPATSVTAHEGWLQPPPKAGGHRRATSPFLR